MISREDSWRLKAAAIIFIVYALLAAMMFFIQEAKAEMDYSSAVIHHTASPDVSVATIDRWHRARGWAGCGYHFVIRRDGTVEAGRPLDRKGAHAKGRNNRIGIALCGYDAFTKEQIEALRHVLHQYGIKHIECHHSACPGKGLNVVGLL